VSVNTTAHAAASTTHTATASARIATRQVSPRALSILSLDPGMGFPRAGGDPPGLLHQDVGTAESRPLLALGAQIET
jgi:hypothetical protein